MLHLIADVGGTNIRFAAIEGTMRAAAQALMAGSFAQTRSYEWAEVGDLLNALQTFREDMGLPKKVTGLTLAIAGPVLDHMAEFRLTNRTTPFTRAQLSQHADQVRIINDFAAQAAVIPLLTEEDLDVLKPGQVQPGARAVLGPGTGLGVAGLGPQGQVFAGEGGNVTVPYLSTAPWSALEGQISGGRLRAEDVFSGQGLENIFAAQTGQRLAAEAISAAAHTGDDQALAAMQLFFDFAAALCADQALQYGAAGGVFLVGAIMQKNRDLLDRDRFAQQFSNIRTHREFLTHIPVYQVTKPTSGLAGVAAYEAAC